MDGTERETVVQFNSTAWPNGLALDAADKQLYWVDAHSDQVSVIDLTTGAIRVLVEQQGAHFFSVDVIGAYLYITDWKKNYLQRMNKHGGALKQFGEAKFTRLYGIKGFNSTEAFKGNSFVRHCGEIRCTSKYRNLKKTSAFI
ncbi:low-density lipoprotein receptor-related protein 5-like protein [Aplysia californica]|uniref:Low-density lipoprotein receptor-related protein 5-like protein n=1 Tax=Aplysia californica TaxID=6500 RepID=A0ABM1A9H0_APLCA|nr:low-density lipoprotein receptor-related protein 5-like protein [Aplysia californica]